MKVLIRETEGFWTREEAVPRFTRLVEQIIEHWDYLLPRGWKLLVEDESAGEKLTLELQSDSGGGSFADVKMQTLKSTPTKCFTGGDSVEHIVRTAMANLPLPGGCLMLDEISSLTRSSDLTRAQHEWLRDRIGYTNFYGAVRVPYEKNFAAATDNRKVTDYNGQLRIAFSGASEEQDVMFALRVLREIQFHQCWYEGWSPYYNLRGLYRAPNIHLWLKELKIKESPRATDFISR